MAELLDVAVVNRGREYTSIPDVVISDTGAGAVVQTYY